MEEQHSPKKHSRIDTLGKGVTLLREAVLILLLILLLLWPSSINGILTSAGFTEANIAGMTWKKTLEESNQETASALQTIEQLKEQLSSVEARLVTVMANTSEPAVRRSVDSAMAGVQALQDSASAVNKSLQRSYVKGQVLLEQIRRPEMQRIAPQSGE